jgi:hypothetical protein
MVEWRRGRRVIMTTLRAQEYTVQDAVKAVKFTGRLVAQSTTEKPDAPRWTTMDLYKISDGVNAGKYVLVVAGQSVLYHAAKSSCNPGIPTTWGELPRDSEPCRTCRPTEDEGIELEDTYTTVHVCDTATDVVGHLQQQHGDGSVTTSRPAARLLRSAARQDPAFEPPVEEL